MRAVVSRMLRSRRAVITMVLVSATILIGSGYKLNWNKKADFYRRFIPDAIGVTSMISEGSTASWFDIRPEPCGGFTFRLSDTMLAKLQDAGIDRIREATAARDPELSDFRYAPWHATPMQSSWLDEGRWMMSLTCLRQNDYSFSMDSVIEAVKEPGSFYAAGIHTEIVVIPRLKLLVFTYDF